MVLLSEHLVRFKRNVALLFIKYSSIKLPLTGLSLLSLWTIRRNFAGAFWAPWLNSILTQAVEFFLLKNKVFHGPSNGWRTTMHQVAIFWAWATLMATIEGFTMRVVESYGWGFLATYALGHVPTFFLRFYVDHKFVFPDRKTPSS